MTRRLLGALLVLCLAAGCSGQVSGAQVRQTACGVATRVCAAVETVCAGTSGGESESEGQRP